MANNNVPTHDFAPAWLKIPSYDCHKPCGGENVGNHCHASRKDEHWVIRREREEPSIHYRYPFADSRWERETHSQSGDRKSTFFPSRHQSIDIDDGQYSSSSSSSGGSVAPNPCGNNLSNSQPSLAPQSNRHRPSSRHDFRDNTFNKGGSLSHYSEVNSNGTHYNNKKVGGGGGSLLSNNDNRSNDQDGIDVTSNNFNQEFPSLKGQEEETKSDSPCPINGSVWENPRNAKVHGVSRKVQLVHRPLKTAADFKEGRSKSPSGLNGLSSCLSPKLNPTAVSLVSPPGKLNGVTSQSNNGFRALIPAKRQTSPLNPPPQTMEILVKNPKMRGNKSEFLKTLRGEIGTTTTTTTTMVIKNNNSSSRSVSNTTEKMDKDINHHQKERETSSLSSSNKIVDHQEGHEDEDEEVQEKELAGNTTTMTTTTTTTTTVENGNNLQCKEHPAMNGIDINKLTVQDNHEKPLLSSSLEAEQRLLREMGWKEDGSDDETYAPLTEDELKEFREITQKVAFKRNGLQKNFHLNWSPKRAPPFSGLILPQPENWSSTSDSDTDSD